ncbi:MAG: Efflux ABC transporter, permease protein, partial [uncultured Blastococcus sp.]
DRPARDAGGAAGAGAAALGGGRRRRGGRPRRGALAPPTGRRARRGAVPGAPAADVHLPAGRRHGRAGRWRLPRLPGARDARPGDGLRRGGDHDRRRHRHRARHHRPVPLTADGALGGGRRSVPGRPGRLRRGARRPARRRARRRLAPRRPRPGAGGRRAAAPAPAGLPLDGHLPRAAGPRPVDGRGRADPGVAVRVPVQRLRGGVVDARLAGDDRRVEPGGRHRDRGPRAVRGARGHGRWLGHRARPAARGRVAGAPDGGLRRTQRAAVPGVVPV